MEMNTRRVCAATVRAGGWGLLLLVTRGLVAADSLAGQSAEDLARIERMRSSHEARVSVVISGNPAIPPSTISLGLPPTMRAGGLRRFSADEAIAWAVVFGAVLEELDAPSCEILYLDGGIEFDLLAPALARLDSAVAQEWFDIETALFQLQAAPPGDTAGWPDTELVEAAVSQTWERNWTRGEFGRYLGIVSDMEARRSSAADVCWLARRLFAMTNQSTGAAREVLAFALVRLFVEQLSTDPIPRQ